MSFATGSRAAVRGDARFVKMFGGSINSGLTWFGSNPAFFYLIALGTTCAFLALAVRRDEPRRPDFRFEVAFLVAIGCSFFAWRWPIFLAPSFLNPDEASWTAAALKAAVDFAPWRGVNLGTSGPLTCYILIPPSLLGLPINFISTRIIGTFLMFGAVVAAYYSISWTYGDRIARLSVVPMVLFLSLTTYPDFVHYSSEHLPIFLTTIALAAAAYLAKPDGSVRARVVAGAIVGSCVGSTCFAKLQAVPIAAVVFAFAMATMVPLWRRSKKEARLIAIAIAVALCAVPGAILVSLLSTGELYYAYLSYIRLSFTYMSGGDNKLPYWFNSSGMYSAFLLCSLAVILFGAILLVTKRRFSPRFAYASSASGLLLLSALFAICLPRRPYAHYLLFSVIPLTVCVASALWVTRESGLWTRHEVPITGLFLAVFLVSDLSVVMSSGNEFLKNIGYNLKHRKSAVAETISQYIRPGELMCIWGWANELYVQTGTLPAARSMNDIRPNAYSDYLRLRYISDLEKWKPPVFVDAVAPDSFEWKDRAKLGHETFPALAAYVRENYALEAEIDGVRIYGMKGRCVVAADQPNGSFHVDARSAPGLATFENNSDQNATFSFSAQGEWTWGWGGPLVGPAGTEAPAPNDFLLPGARSFALIAQRKDGTTQFVGEGSKLTLGPHEIISFMMNDTAGDAGDNRGSLTISWTRK